MIPKSRITIKNVMPELAKILNQYNWNMDDNQFSMILSMVMYPADNVRFTPAEGEHLMEMYVGGIAQTFLDSSILRYKEQIIKNLLDEKENPLYVELGKILDKAFEWRRYLEKLNKQRPMMFDSDHTLQWQLDMNVEDFIELAVNEQLEYDYTDIYDIYHTFLPKMEKTVRNEVAKAIDEGDFDQSPDALPHPSAGEKPEFEHYDYILFKKELRKRREQEAKLKVHDELNPDEDLIDTTDPGQESEVETPPKSARKKRKLKRKKKKS